MCDELLHDDTRIFEERNGTYAYGLFENKQDLNFVQKLDMYDFYLFASDDVKFINMALESIFHMKYYNSLALTLTISNKLSVVFDLVWNYYLIKVLVLHGSEVYTYYPITKGNCSISSATPTLLTTCENIPNNIYNMVENAYVDFNGCPFRIYAVGIMPFVEANTSYEQNKGF